MKRFWSPFCRGLVGPNLQMYGFSQVFDSIRTDDNDFTCQVNGQVGGTRLIEDFFIVILCGFDFVDVKVESSSMTDAVRDPCNFKGFYVLAHSRPFLGWAPFVVAPSLEIEPHDKGSVVSSFDRSEPSELQEDSSGNQLLVHSRNSNAEQPRRLLKVPFTSRIEEHEGGLSHMTLRSPIFDVIMGDHNCPATLKHCLQNKEAIEAIVRLRRANVRPELITDKTLLAITTKKESWASALGIL
ncbi:hypothetical protein TraAM80_02412 [Trypanosoma rangeli]|uniref:Uncharacterized protein n=1 Tax=Trypanosoma rangeli TaxID=5698 RepID=A0A3R7NNI3_TRYRA|nr:uncharacterized protein TraAM80_02412 [Trypanosoma rangeli]RNF09015.1 hypothetical protein TraAM80_02412 [Trypanosoma rangeli]|eukprot:RNF09015.1 hypothetical protein TraAM80_02412 [Trypanosoma rangeli]